jgi:adhesin HecA-like repeat protein
LTNIGGVGNGDGTAVPTVTTLANTGKMFVDGPFVVNGDSAASLTVSETLTNRGGVVIGNGKAAPMVTIGALDDQSGGGVEIVRGTVTVRGDVTNDGSGTDDGISVTGGELIVADTLTNTGGVRARPRRR